MEIAEGVRTTQIDAYAFGRQKGVSGRSPGHWAGSSIDWTTISKCAQLRQQSRRRCKIQQLSKPPMTEVCGVRTVRGG